MAFSFPAGSAIDLSPPASNPARPSARVHRSAGVRPPPQPRWLRAVDAVHRGAHSAAAPVVDAVLLLGAAAVSGLPAWPVLPIVVALVAVLAGSGRYAERGPLETQGVLWSVRELAMPTAAITVVGATLAHLLGHRLVDGFTFAGLVIAQPVVLRVATWGILAAARRRGLGLQRTLVFGEGPAAERLSRTLADHPESGLAPVGRLEVPAPLDDEGHDAVASAMLAVGIEELDAGHVVLVPGGGERHMLAAVRECSDIEAHFSLLPPMPDLFLRPGRIAQVGGLPLIPLGRVASCRSVQPGKRVLDLVLTTGLLALLAPLMLVVALLVKLTDRGPVLYRQRRVGRDGRVFELLKFRSMVVGAERQVVDLRDHNASDGLLFKVRDDPRVTPVGRVIRRLSIDELPQLLNVLRGEMSLVGPRPLAVEPSDFDAFSNRRHRVTPGITGYWQISGGNGLTYDEMIRLDLAYITNWTLWLDIRLLLRTIPALAVRRDPW
jgi:exopolysaccharide biosynthesis polyprenyl glycosylphosphotransferase